MSSRLRGFAFALRLEKIIQPIRGTACVYHPRRADRLPDLIRRVCLGQHFLPNSRTCALMPLDHHFTALHFRFESARSFLPNRNLVLVVDDDGAMLRGVKRLLRQHGYDSVLFSSAQAFETHGDFEKAVCIILDINLNDGSGIELRHRLKAAGISVPVIYMTGNPAVRVAAQQSGCVAYLTKPFSAKSLIEPLQRASAGLT
jgi:CheY-like chemotaxis protein